MPNGDDAKRLNRDSSRQRVNLIETDIDTAMTLLRFAVTELSLGHSSRVAQLVAKARAAHKTVGSFLGDVADENERQHLHERHQALGDTLRDVERRTRRYDDEARP